MALSISSELFDEGQLDVGVILYFTAYVVHTSAESLGTMCAVNVLQRAHI